MLCALVLVLVARCAVSIAVGVVREHEVLVFLERHVYVYWSTVDDGYFSDILTVIKDVSESFIAEGLRVIRCGRGLEKVDYLSFYIYFLNLCFVIYLKNITFAVLFTL